MCLRWPDEPTTSEQWQVIAWAAIVVCLVLGGIGMGCSFWAPANKAELAAAVRWYSLMSWLLAAAIYGLKRVIEHFVA
jgi:hypothetical protein